MIKQLLAEQPATAVVILIAAMMVGVFLERGFSWFARQAYRRKKGWTKYPGWQRSRSNLDALPRHDSTPADVAAEQLKIVMKANFNRRPLLNQSELRVFSAIEKLLEAEKVDWRVMAQVSMGEIVGSKDQQAYLAVNSKRVDLSLVDRQGIPLHAIEYQGAGHHQGTAAARDAVKKEALRKAGIGYAEVLAGDRLDDLRAVITKLTRS
jgi:Protein of unknown function (DUF2726)